MAAFLGLASGRERVAGKEKEKIFLPMRKTWGYMEEEEEEEREQGEEEENKGGRERKR